MKRTVFSVLFLLSGYCQAQALTHDLQLIEKQKFQRVPFVELFEFEKQMQQVLQGGELEKQSNWQLTSQGKWQSVSSKETQSIWARFWIKSKAKKQCLVQLPIPHVNQNLLQLADNLASKKCSALAVARLHPYSLDFSRARYLPQTHPQSHFNYFIKAWHQVHPEGKSIQLFQIQPPTFGIRKETEAPVWSKADIFLSHGLPMDYDSLPKVTACLNKAGFSKVVAFGPGMHLIDETQITQRSWAKQPQQFLRVGFTENLLKVLMEQPKQQTALFNCLVH